MREGYRIIDTDTHVGPNVETLQVYAGPVLKERWGELDQYYQQVTEGHHLSISPGPFKRQLNTSMSGGEVVAGGKIPLRGKTSMNFTEPPAPEVNNLNAAGRLSDMDREGVDVHVIIPATFANAATVLDNQIATELYDAYHRYLDDYCGVDANRLKGCLLVGGQDVDWSLGALNAYADKPWAAAVIVILPEGLPV